MIMVFDSYSTIPSHRKTQISIFILLNLFAILMDYLSSLLKTPEIGFLTCLNGEYCAIDLAERIRLV